MTTERRTNDFRRLRSLRLKTVENRRPSPIHQSPVRCSMANAPPRAHINQEIYKRGMDSEWGPRSSLFNDDFFFFSPSLSSASRDDLESKDQFSALGVRRSGELLVLKKLSIGEEVTHVSHASLDSTRKRKRRRD